MDDLTWLQHWYESISDIDLDSYNRARIETLDNPGWSVRIDLADTPFAAHADETLIEQGVGSQADPDSNDWVYCFIKAGRFEGVGGPQKLTLILKTFREWVERIAPPVV